MWQYAAVRQCGAVCGSVWQCGSACVAVQQCVAVCAVVCGSVRGLCGSVWQCMAVHAAVYGSALYIYIHSVAHNLFIGIPLCKGQWD
jgi:hypothetical protein